MVRKQPAGSHRMRWWLKLKVFVQNSIYYLLGSTNMDESYPTLLPKRYEGFHYPPRVDILVCAHTLLIHVPDFDLQLVCGSQSVDQPTEGPVKGSPVDVVPGEARHRTPKYKGDFSNARRGDGRNDFRFLISEACHD